MIKACHFLGRFNLHELFPYKICIHAVNDKILNTEENLRKVIKTAETYFAREIIVLPALSFHNLI